jgi:hypothetical protein
MPMACFKTAVLVLVLVLVLVAVDVGVDVGGAQQLAAGGEQPRCRRCNSSQVANNCRASQAYTKSTLHPDSGFMLHGATFMHRKSNVLGP